MKKIFNSIDYIFEKKILTIPVIIFIFSGFVSGIIWRLSINYAFIADFFTDTISFAMRFILTKATYFIPFSLAEMLLFISVPSVLFLLFRFIINIRRSKYYGKTKTAIFFKGIFRVFAFCGFVLFIFTFTLGVCYGKTPVNEKINFERRLLGVEDLYSAMEILIAEADKAADKIQYVYADTGSTKMPYGLKDLNKKLNEAYIITLEKHDMFKRISSKVKPVILSVEMSKMHITGVYSFFTGEANVNIDFPDYNLPYVAAHEMAHLMGVGREDEANFTAFLVCLYSNDDYIRYSGLVNMIEYIGNALYREDSEKYYEVTRDMHAIIKSEMSAFSRFFDKYRNAPSSKIASAANNTYLKAQGQEQGIKSYGFVVDLAVVYLLDIY